jgi:hypothetical protein
VQTVFSSILIYRNLEVKVYRTIILPVVLYGCETWSLTLWEECRKRVLVNRVLRRIFGPKRDEVTGEWRKVHNEGLNDLYCLSSIFRVVKARRMRWAGHVALKGKREGLYKFLVETPEGKGPLGRQRHRWEDNIKLGLHEVGCRAYELDRAGWG